MILLATMVAAARARSRAQAAHADKPIMAGPTMTAGNAGKLQQVGAAILFWTQEQRDPNFPHMENVFPGHVVKARGPVRPLPKGKPLTIAAAVVDPYSRTGTPPG